MCDSSVKHSKGCWFPAWCSYSTFLVQILGSSLIQSLRCSVSKWYSNSTVDSGHTNAQPVSFFHQKAIVGLVAGMPSFRHTHSYLLQSLRCMQFVFQKYREVLCKMRRYLAKKEPLIKQSLQDEELLKTMQVDKLREREVNDMVGWSNLRTCNLSCIFLLRSSRWLRWFDTPSAFFLKLKGKKKANITINAKSRMHRGSGFVLGKKGYDKCMMLKNLGLGWWEGRKEGQFQL